MADSTLQIQADFDRLAAFGDGGWDHNRHYHAGLLRSLPPKRELALEVGCGTGDFARVLARHFQRVIAIDLSPEMVRRARELSRRLTTSSFGRPIFSPAICRPPRSTASPPSRRCITCRWRRR